MINKFYNFAKREAVTMQKKKLIDKIELEEEITYLVNI